MLNFSQFGLIMVVLLVEDKYGDLPKPCAVVSEILDDALKWWMCFVCVLEVDFCLAQPVPWESFPGGVCILSPSSLAPRDKRSRFVLWCGQEQVVGQAGTLTAMVPHGDNRDGKRTTLLVFLFLRNVASQLKWTGAFGVRELHLLFSVNNLACGEIVACGREGSSGRALVHSSGEGEWL